MCFTYAICTWKLLGPIRLRRRLSAEHWLPFDLHVADQPSDGSAVEVMARLRDCRERRDSERRNRLVNMPFFYFVIYIFKLFFGFVILVEKFNTIYFQLFISLHINNNSLCLWKY